MRQRPPWWIERTTWHAKGFPNRNKDSLAFACRLVSIVSATHCLAPRGCKHRAKYQSTCVNKHNYVRYSYLFCTIDDSFADLNLSDYLDTVFYTSPKMCKWCVMTINIVFRSFTEITERTGAGTSVPRYVSPDHCTVVYRYTGYTAHPY